MRFPKHFHVSPKADEIADTTPIRSEHRANKIVADGVKHDGRILEITACTGISTVECLRRRGLPHPAGYKKSNEVHA